MHIINEEIENKIIINKSIFITCLLKINKKEQIEEKLNLLKNKYKDATHYTYAYIISQKQGFSDDKEPTGTAGIPILDILKRKNLTNILCVVIRYFRGVKLGVGGLIRAYRKSVLEAINLVKLKKIIDGYYIEIIENYDKQKEIEQIIDNYQKKYEESITYYIYCDDNTYQKLKKYNITKIEQRKITLN